MDGPFEVRRVLDARGAQRLEARIRWRGVDPATQMPYPEQWVLDCDEHGNVMNGALLAAARRLEAARYDCRVRRRRAAASSAFRERPEGARRCSRLRSEEESEAVQPSGRRRRRLAVVSDSSEDEEQE